MKEYYADKTCLNMLRIIILAATVIVIAATSYFLSFIPKIMIVFCIVFFAAGFFLSLIYLPLYFKKLKYIVDDEIIVKESGFIFVKKQSMKINKIQHTTTISTPFSIMTGLNFIVFYAYGGRLSVMFLSNENFAEMIYNLKE